jgi:hypothetical protein
MNTSIVVTIDQSRALMRHDTRPNQSLHISSSDGRRIKLIGRIMRPQQLQGLQCEIYISNERSPEARASGILGAVEYDVAEDDLSRSLRIVIGVEPRMFREFWRRSLTPPRRMQVTLHARGPGAPAAAGRALAVEGGQAVVDLDVIFMS